MKNRFFSSPETAINSNYTRRVHFATKHEDDERNSDEHKDEEVDTTPTVRPTISSIMSSRKVNPTRTVKVNQAAILPEGEGLVDGGADTCMIGPEFYHESTHTDRTVNVEGFDGPDKVVKDLPIGTGIAAVDLPNETILLRVNEGIVTKQKTIFSTNQL